LKLYLETPEGEKKNRHLLHDDFIFCDDDDNYIGDLSTLSSYSYEESVGGSRKIVKGVFLFKDGTTQNFIFHDLADGPKKLKDKIKEKRG
jgi:hypothetical protein